MCLNEHTLAPVELKAKHMVPEWSGLFPSDDSKDVRQ